MVLKIILLLIFQYLWISTVFAEASVQDESEKKRLMLFRLFPALATVAIFIGGVVAVSVRYWMKVKEQRETVNKPLEDKETASSWLEKLRQTQDGGGVSIARRRTTLFGKKFLANNKLIRMKKYALYEDMLAKYKHQLRMQKIHSMRSMAKTMSESVDHDNEETGGGKKIERGKRAGSGRMRMRDLALRHRMTHEQQDNWQLEAMMQGDMEPVFWMSTATQELSNVKDDGSGRKISRGASFETREAINLKQVNIDIDSLTSPEKEDPKIKETGFTTSAAGLKLSRESLQEKKTVPEKSLQGMSYQIEIDHPYVDSEENEDQKDADEDGHQNIVCAQVLHEHDDDSSIPLLEAEKKEKLMEEGVRLRPKSNNRKRPKSMFGSLNSKKFAYLPDDDGNWRKKEKRKSWISGLFNGKDESKKSSKRLSMNDIDNFIDDQMEKALVMYISKEQIDDSKIIEMLGEGEEREPLDTLASQIPTQTSIDRSGSMPNVRVQHRSRRPVTWFACTNDSKDIKERKLSNRRPKSLSLIEKLKERFRAAESAYFDEKTITELFAGLMDLQTDLTGSQSGIAQVPSTSLPELDDTRQHEESIHLKSSHIDQVLQEVERRMIQHLNDRDELESNEVEALEKLLDDITKFSTEYGDDFEDVEERRQLTFSQVNTELMEVEHRAASRQDQSPIPTIDPSQPGSSVEHPQDFEMSLTHDEKEKRDSLYDTNLERTTRF